MVDTRMISPDVFRARRILSRHKQESLAAALGCSTRAVRDFELGKRKRMYSVAWPDLKRELGLDKAA